VKAKHSNPILQLSFNYKYTVFDQGNGNFLYIDKVFDNLSLVLPELTFKFDCDTILILSNHFNSISKKFSFSTDPHKKQLNKIFKAIAELSCES